MKRLNVLVGAFMVARTAAFAHGGNDYVRGVVTKISAQSAPVQTADKASKTLMLTDKTTLEQAGKVAQLSDLHVGDRLVIEVANTTRALLMQVGAAPKTADSIRVSKVEMPNSSKYRFRAGGTRWSFFSINPAGPSVFLQSLIASPRSARDGPIVLFHQAVAERWVWVQTDHTCLDLLRERGVDQPVVLCQLSRWTSSNAKHDGHLPGASSCTPGHQTADHSDSVRMNRAESL